MTQQTPKPHQGGANPPTMTTDELYRVAMPVVRLLARRISRGYGRHADRDELVSVGYAALPQVIANFDPMRSAFAPYIWQRVSWAMRAEVRKITRRRLNPQRGLPLGASLRFGDSQPRRLYNPPGDEHQRTPSLHEVDGGVAGIVCAGGDLCSAALAREDNPEKSTTQRETSREVRRALGSLPASQQRILRRHYYEGERFTQLAADIGISKTKASRLHRAAVDNLAKELRQRGVVGEPGGGERD